MRIIGGCFKGKKLLQPNDFKTRPLKDLTKESIFNIINHTKKFNINLNSSVVLDLFSGVGSFGIECISRGVKNVVFIENYRNVLTVLKKNLINLKSVSNYEVIESSLESMKSFPVESLSIRYNLTNPELYGDFAEYSLLQKKRVNLNHYQEDIKATQFIYKRRSAAIGWQSKDTYVFSDNGLPILTEQTLSPLQRSIRISFHYKY